jgi:hypothetical protein
MQSVIETSVFLRDAGRARLSDEERMDIVDLIASNPTIGDVMPGTGGARKVRIAGRGKGKSGGHRVVTYYAAEDVPILLLALIDKGDRADLSKADKNELRHELSGYADDHRASVAEMAARFAEKGDKE